MTIRVPEPSGGFRLMKATKEIDCTLEAAGMKDGANGQQFRRFLPHRTAMAESKAFMRAIRAALGLAGTYAYEELKALYRGPRGPQPGRPRNQAGRGEQLPPVDGYAL